MYPNENNIKKHKWEFSTHLIVFSVVGTGKQQCSFPHFSEAFLETQYLIALYEKSSY